jgi:hypothetical protein
VTWSVIGAIYGNPYTGPTTFTFTPNATAAIGDLILMEVINDTGSGSGIASALSSTNATWAPYGAGFTGATNAGFTAQVFGGTLTSTSSATVTITWSGTAPSAHVSVDGFGFRSTVGSWAFDVGGHIDSAGTTTWASLTPSSGAGELYFGYALDGTTAVAGSTSGYVYTVDSDSNGVAYNLNCGAGATAPVWGDSSQVFGAMVLVMEQSAAITSGPQVNRQLPNFPAYQVFSAGRMGGGHSV